MVYRYMWTLPFIFFLGGYSAVHFFFTIQRIETPSLVGQTISQVLITLSKYKLNPRILDEKEDADLPEGTILSQTPAAGQQIKPNQSIYLLISKQPHAHHTPNLLNKPYTEIRQICSSQNIPIETHTLPNNYPNNHCFAQFPSAQEQLKKQKLILYISTENNVPVIWPDFTHAKVPDVLGFLQTYNLYPQIVHQRDYGQNHVCKDCKVLQQNPRAGSLIILNENKPFRIQLEVY